MNRNVTLTQTGNKELILNYKTEMSSLPYIDAKVFNKLLQLVPS